MINTQIYHSPIGDILIAEKENVLTGAWIEGQKYYLSTVKESLISNKQSVVLNLAMNWFESYFLGERPSISDLPLAPVGSEFQQSVWKILCQIPYGEVMTYGEIAQMIASKRGLKHMSAQAVGGAVGRNPISIMIPCHRVIGANGRLTGYAGGIDKKEWLLAHETCVSGISAKIYPPKE